MATLLAAPGVVVRSGGRCAVRLLGTDGGTSFAFVSCSGDNGEGAGVPVRVEGDRVRIPEDGGGYTDDVEEMFPKGIAELILERSPLISP